jgi:hypothetical protein
MYVAGIGDVFLNPNFVTTKYASNGDQEWIAVCSNGSPCGTASDAAGNVYVGGTSNIDGESFFTLIKYVQKPTPVNNESNSLPIRHTLRQNFPNPFNPETNVEFRIVNCELVKLSVYDVLGREVAVLVDEEKPAGAYTATWDASGMPSGIYFYRLTAGEFTQTRKMMLMK